MKYKNKKGGYNMREDMIVFETEDGESVEMIILEETSVNGKNYILVTEADDEEEGEAYIFKDMSDADEEEAMYEPVEDEAELEAVGRIFEELLEDTEVVY